MKALRLASPRLSIPLSGGVGTHPRAARARDQKCSLRVNELHAVVHAHGSRLNEGVADSYGVGRIHQSGDLCKIGPSNVGGFDAVAVWVVEGGAAEDESDHAAVEVLVDAGEAIDGDLDAGLRKDFPTNSFVEGLAEFEDSAWGLPVPVVPAADHQHLPRWVDDNASDADGVLWCVQGSKM